MMFESDMESAIADLAKAIAKWNATAWTRWVLLLISDLVAMCGNETSRYTFLKSLWTSTGELLRLEKWALP